MVEARRNGEKAEERHDLFSGLLDAAQDEPGSEAALRDKELFGGYSTSGSFGILKGVLPVLQETCLFSFLLDMRCELYFPAELS